MPDKNNIIEDTLARKLFAKKIADEIEENHLSGDRANLFFAISGKWGVGKTRILEIMDDILTKKKFSIIWFNPWQYSQKDISLKRAFLEKVKKDLKSDFDIGDLYYDRTKTEIDWYIFFAALFLAYLFIFRPLLDFLQKNPSYTSIIIVGITAFFLPLLLSLISIKKSSAKITTAEQFEEKFKGLINGNKKVVIFIDDLDRCSPKTVKRILDSLRTFFKHDNCSYIITGDHTVIERYAGDELNVEPVFWPKNGDHPSGGPKVIDEEATARKRLREGRRFIKKLFDVYWTIPLPTKASFDEFVEAEIKKSDIDFPDIDMKEAIQILTNDKYFEWNPRHVIRNLTSTRFAIGCAKERLLETMEKEKNINIDKSTKEYQEIKKTLKIDKQRMEDIKKTPVLMMKTILIQDLFYPIFEELCKTPSWILKHEEQLFKGEKLDDLMVNEKKLNKILDDDEVKLYCDLIKTPPHFTDPKTGDILHEAGSFFSVSGFSGIPSTVGPGEGNFLNALKGGQLVANAKLMESFKTAPPDTNEQLAKIAFGAFDSSQNNQEKINIILETIKVAIEIDDWVDMLRQWKDRIYNLPQPDKEKVKNEFMRAILVKQPELIDIINQEGKVEFIDEIWQILNHAKSLEKFHPESGEKLIQIALDDLDITPPGLKATESLIGLLDDKNEKQIVSKVQNSIKNLAIAKSYLEELKKQELLKGKVYQLVKENIKKLIPRESKSIEWLVENEVLLSEFDFLEDLRGDIFNLRNETLEFLMKIIRYHKQLKFDGERKSQILGSLLKFIEKTKDFDILNNGDVISFIKEKEEKKKVFEMITKIVEDNKEKSTVRESAISLLDKSNKIWDEITKEDISESLLLLKKLKLNKKLKKLNQKKKEVLSTWG